MELDDLRRQWLHPLPPGPAIDAPQLRAWLAHGSGGAVANMRRNAWLEVGLLSVCFLGSALAVFYADSVPEAALPAWMMMICVLSGFYYHRKLAVLQRLSEASGALREHMAQQLQGLRKLVELYHRFTMWSLPISFGVALLAICSRILGQPRGPKLVLHLGIVVVCFGAVGALTYWALRSQSRWYLQRLYGQHLDRLEANLRELDDLGPPLW